MEPLSRPKIATDVMVKLYNGPMRSKALTDSVTQRFSISEPTAYALLKELVERGLIKKDKVAPKNVQYGLTSQGQDAVEKSYLNLREGLISVLRQSPARDIIILDVFVSDVESRFVERNIQISPDFNLRKYLLEVGKPLMATMKEVLYEQAKMLCEQAKIVMEDRILERDVEIP